MDKKPNPESWSFLDTSRKALEAARKKKAKGSQVQQDTDQPHEPVTGADNLIEAEPDVGDCIRGSTRRPS
ncbi:hypothetical protein [Legionella nagasakiensis]|uniref:hypothetical protein n=1 Tax=Legionella nagasakiensis TaxID=535290 RepID=UPI001054C289|nr:hypothetical protein [Legionella nagasakiensis]